MKHQLKLFSATIQGLCTDKRCLRAVLYQIYYFIVFYQLRAVNLLRLMDRYLSVSFPPPVRCAEQARFSDCRLGSDGTGVCRVCVCMWVGARVDYLLSQESYPFLGWSSVSQHAPVRFTGHTFYN